MRGVVPLKSVESAIFMHQYQNYLSVGLVALECRFSDQLIHTDSANC